MVLVLIPEEPTGVSIKHAVEVLRGCLPLIQLIPLYRLLLIRYEAAINAFRGCYHYLTRLLRIPL